MGLTVHYQQKDKDQKVTEKKAKECLDCIKDIAQMAGIKIYSQGEDVDTNGHRITWVSLLPHPKSETLLFEFDLTEGKLKNEYGYHFFCKTHFADFLTHKKVCRMLEMVSSRFIELDVYDEGDYYGIWDDDKGKKVFGEYQEFVAEFSNKLKKELGNDNVITGEEIING